MKTNLILSGLAIIALAALGSPAAAQTDDQPGNGFRVGGFLDENGDGFNDLAPDADGDGIPNGLDPDYVPAGDGSGNRYGDGDGVCDQDGGLQAMLKAMGEGGNSYGPGDGSGFGGEGPGDGTGFGPGTGAGDGTCDGSGATAAAGGLGQRGRR